MFTVKAAVSKNFEFAAAIAVVQEFFGDIRNFAELMPGVRQVHTDASGVAHLKIEAEIPVVGTMTQSFAVRPTEESADRVEWIPVSTETKNFLRYSADFMEGADGTTQVQFSQAVELRRDKARDFHFLAGMAGEALISTEMTKRFVEMVNIFIDGAKKRLGENNSSNPL